MKAETIAKALGGRKAGGWMARCPAHERSRAEPFFLVPGEDFEERCVMIDRAKPQHIRLLLTETECRAWLITAKPGEVLEYHRGYLAIDRLTLGSRLPREECEELHRAAKAALALAEAGRAHLLQRRHGDGDYIYLLVARPKRLLLPCRTSMAAEAAP